MNKRLKQSIKAAYQAPKPDEREKHKFLGALPRSKISMGRFILIQASYMRKQTILLSMLLMIAMIIAAGSVAVHVLWASAALMPFLGILAVSESTRSMAYGMEELEMSTAFSLKSVVLARMCVLGLLDTAILGSLIIFCCNKSEVPLLEAMAYILTPYMLTVSISLWLARHFHGKEVIYACLSAAVAVSLGDAGLKIFADFVYSATNIGWWFIVLAFLVWRMVFEVFITIKHSEEYYGTDH